jgi:hypothetical protein
MWDFHDSIELFDLVKGVDTWGQTTMEAEDVVLNDCGQRQVVEKRGEVLPNICISVLSQALIVETIHLCDLL